MVPWFILALMLLPLLCQSKDLCGAGEADQKTDPC